MISLIEITKDNIFEYKRFDVCFNNYLSQCMSRIYPDNDKVVKWCYINVDNKNIGSVWLEKIDVYTAKLGVFIVDEQYRNNGYGTDAIRKMLFFAKDNGYQDIFLNVRINNARAFKVYKKLGFNEIKRFVKNNGVEVIVMKYSFLDFER